jgi:hypothetical protein
MNNKKTQLIEKFRSDMVERSLKLPENERKDFVEKNVRIFTHLQEDEILYNKQIKLLYKELNARYDLSKEEVLTKLREMIIQDEIKEKEEFFFGKKQVTDQPVREYTQDRHPIVREIVDDDTEFVIVDPNNEEEQKAWREKGRKIVALDDTPNEVAFEKFKKEVFEKYSNIDNIAVKQQEIIAQIVKQESVGIKRRVEMKRKLQYYDEELGNVKNKAKKLESYAKELEQFFIPHGVDVKEYDDKACKTLQYIHADFEKRKHDDADWSTYDDDYKLEFFKIKYEEFFNSNPLVIKMMVISDMFSLDAFKKFLVKCRNNVAPKTNPFSQNSRPQKIKNKEKLTASEEKWLENNAFFVEYLHDDLHYKKTKSHLTNDRKMKIRLNAYNMLRQEMSSFKSRTQKRSDELLKESDHAKLSLFKDFLADVKEGYYQLKCSDLDVVNEVREKLKVLDKLKDLRQAELENSLKLQQKLKESAPSEPKKRRNRKKRNK